MYHPLSAKFKIKYPPKGGIFEALKWTSLEAAYTVPAEGNIPWVHFDEYRATLPIFQIGRKSEQSKEVISKFLPGFANQT